MKKITFYTIMSNNIGQMPVRNADKEIERMQQQTNLKWRKDFSDFLYVVDETDDEANNPTSLCKNFCWVVTDGEKLI